MYRCLTPPPGGLNDTLRPAPAIHIDQHEPLIGSPAVHGFISERIEGAGDDSRITLDSGLGDPVEASFYVFASKLFAKVASQHPNIVTAAIRECETDQPVTEVPRCLNVVEVWKYGLRTPSKSGGKTSGLE